MWLQLIWYDYDDDDDDDDDADNDDGKCTLVKSLLSVACSTFFEKGFVRSPLRSLGRVIGFASH